MAIKDVIAPVQKQLKDLFRIGDDVEFQRGDTIIKVWVERVSPAQDREAVQHSYKARAATLVLLKNKEHPERLAYRDTLESHGLMERDSQILLLIREKVQQAQLTAQAKIGAKDEWAENDYLITLQQAWNDGLSDKWALDNDDEEAKRIYDELLKFRDQVNSSLERDIENLVSGYDFKSDEEILEEAIDYLIQDQANSEQIAEYNKWCVYFASRLIEDKDKLFFDSREDIDTYPKEIYRDLLEKLKEISVDDYQGKE